MKYMGSKRWMLANGLGRLILEESRHKERVVDLFCGSGAVSWFAAQSTQLPVLAVDIQEYAKVLAGAVVERDAPLDAPSVSEEWIRSSKEARDSSSYWDKALALDREKIPVREMVRRARSQCEEPSGTGPVWNAYGGFYFSPVQALTLDFMLAHLPREPAVRSACLAAAIIASSQCAAAPGHTAQPFRPTRSAGRFIREAWAHDPAAEAEKALRQVCPQHATTKGVSLVADARAVAEDLGERDLAIVDPPYSGVQYSRFYHVFETIARGSPEEVDGAGRYPPLDRRPQSEFSKRSTARDGLEGLVAALADAGAAVILTFPAGRCSNGLSGRVVREIAAQRFEIHATVVNGRFSTLGGNNDGRASRKRSRELILTMHPRRG